MSPQFGAAELHDLEMAASLPYLGRTALVRTTSPVL